MARRPSQERALARQIAILRLAAETGSVIRAAWKIGDKNEKLIEETRRLSEGVAEELMREGTYVSYNESCRVAADRLEAKARGPARMR